ncbi:MAG TPA: BPL-N domain-containing protein [Chlamydiales bacterium]|nr:BPL-N domain-containing protein [Chlamydiales bacterium]
MIRSVIVYKGHGNDLRGPYGENVIKQIDMFHILNRYRAESGRPPWTVTPVVGENLIEALRGSKPKETLLVIPAGQSSHLDKVFSVAETSFIREQFLAKGGGRLYATCGASYAMSAVRKYNGLSTQHPDRLELRVVKSVFPVFEGEAEGPLCPYPGARYKVGFYSDAVTVQSEKDHCTIYLSGGGSFFLPQSGQKVKVLVKYLDSELARLGKPAHCSNATILAKVGKGAALLSMFHPYYGPNDIDVEAYERTFPNCGTNWRAVQENLSPLDVRMRFVLNAMLFPLEDAEGD